MLFALENILRYGCCALRAKMPCSHFLAKKTTRGNQCGEYNVKQKMMCHENNQEPLRSHGLLLQRGYIRHFVHCHCCVDKKRVKRHIIPRIII